MFKRLTVVMLTLIMAGILSAGCQQEGSYPNKPVEYVVHASAGGGTDIMARTVASILDKEGIVSQTLNVVNKPGGSGGVSAAYVAEKKGDPYFIYNVTGVLVKTPLQGKSKVTYRDFTPVANFVMDYNCLVVNADSPYKTLQDLIDAAKSGKEISQGGGSISSSENMAGFLVKRGAGVEWEFVSFESGGDAMTALLGGHVDLVCPSPNEVTEHLRAGKIRVLAVTSPKRLDIWPDVPTLKELNLESCPPTFRGVVMPKDVPEESVNYWQTAFQKMMETEQWKKFVRDSAMSEEWMAGKEFGDYMGQNEKELEALMKDMGLMK